MEYCLFAQQKVLCRLFHYGSHKCFYYCLLLSSYGAGCHHKAAPVDELLWKRRTQRPSLKAVASTGDDPNCENTVSHKVMRDDNLTTVQTNSVGNSAFYQCQLIAFCFILKVK